MHLNPQAIVAWLNNPDAHRPEQKQEEVSELRRISMMASFNDVFTPYSAGFQRARIKSSTAAAGALTRARSRQMEAEPSCRLEPYVEKKAVERSRAMGLAASRH